MERLDRAVLIKWSLWLMATLYILAGLNHFRKPGFYRPMMPPWIPKHELMIQLSGYAEVLLGILLFVEQTRALAAWGVILLLIAVSPVHIYMVQARKTVFHRIPTFVIFGRLPLQLVLMYWAWMYTY